jgi:NAD(P)-dependent dehydrogenase (short-subunit alcohol dehydrogenase family)
MTTETNASAPVIIVTGASGNLGGAVITQLVAQGARVVAVERARVRYGDAVLASIDLGSAELVSSAFASVAARLGGIDAVVHTVGVYQGGKSLLDTSAEDFTALFQTNVVATANVLRAALSVMLPQRRGQIAVVASADALSGAADRSAYSASKGAQLRLVESAAEEVRGRGITVNALLPTTLDTPQNRAAQPTADRSRWLPLADVANVLAYLVSPSAAAIHGESIRLGRSPTP